MANVDGINGFSFSSFPQNEIKIKLWTVCMKHAQRVVKGPKNAKNQFGETTLDDKQQRWTTCN